MSDIDVQTVQVDSAGVLDPEWAAMEVVAKKAAILLSKVYANHWWMIGTAPGGVLCIKHGEGDSRFGFTIDVPAAHSASDLEKAIIMGGGELLERMGLARGARDWNDDAQQFEGQDHFLRSVT